MKQIAVLLAALMLSACGFSPVYKSGAATNTSIIVDEIPGRSGHVLRKALLEQLAVGLPGIEDSATLTVSLDEDLRRLALRPDQAASRTDIRAEGNYVLAFPGNAISGEVKVETSFNVPDAPYGDIAAQVDAADRAMNELARRITDDIRIKLAASE